MYHIQKSFRGNVSQHCKKISNIMYIFSSFNKVISTERGLRLYNNITKKSVGYDKLIESLSVKFCQQQINTLEDDIDNKLLQIITAELLSRGVIIPIEQMGNELDYLNLISPLQLPEFGFLNCKTVDSNLINKKNKIIAFFGVPCDLGASRPGTRYGPKLLRSKSLSINFRGKNAIILDIKKSQEIKIENLIDLGDINLTTSNLSQWIIRVKYLLNSLPLNVIPFMIGGDHAFTLSAVEALWKTRAPFVFIQLDHHLDIQIWGEFENDKPKQLDLLSHGNFVSFIKDTIPQIDIVQIGVSRYQSIGNKKYLGQISNYLNYISKKITDFAIQNDQIEHILSQLPQKNNVYLSIDVDAINSIFIRDNTGFPAHTGMSLEKFLKIVDFISSNNNIIGVDIMEYGISDKAEAHNSSSTIIINAILNILQNIN